MFSFVSALYWTEYKKMFTATNNVLPLGGKYISELAKCGLSTRRFCRHLPPDGESISCEPRWEASLSSWSLLRSSCLWRLRLRSRRNCFCLCRHLHLNEASRSSLLISSFSVSFAGGPLVSISGRNRICSLYSSAGIRCKQKLYMMVKDFSIDIYIWW